MYTVRIFDTAQRGRRGIHVANTFEPNACAVLVSVLGEHAIARCGACDWCVWDAYDHAEHPDASYDALATLLEDRVLAHVHEYHVDVRLQP